jgi:hypothetical protein
VTVEWRFRTVGIVLAIAVHGLVLGGVVLGHSVDAQHTDKRTRSIDEKNKIEAGLARRADVAAGPKSKLPQKPSGNKVKPPDAHGVATDPNRVTDPKAAKDDSYVPPEKIDFNSIASKARGTDTSEGDTEPTGGGSGQTNVTGQPDGSEFGTLDVAKGDPYIGELVGRISVDFTAPGTIDAELRPGEKLETWACVRLDLDGNIVDRKLDPEHKSRIAAFNSAVNDRLRADSLRKMSGPVPTDPSRNLVKLLVERYACVVFSYP